MQYARAKARYEHFAISLVFMVRAEAFVTRLQFPGKIYFHFRKGTHGPQKIQGPFVYLSDEVQL